MRNTPRSGMPCPPLPSAKGRLGSWYNPLGVRRERRFMLPLGSDRAKYIHRFLLQRMSLILPTADICSAGRPWGTAYMAHTRTLAPTWHASSNLSFWSGFLWIACLVGQTDRSADFLMLHRCQTISYRPEVGRQRWCTSFPHSIFYPNSDTIPEMLKTNCCSAVHRPRWIVCWRLLNCP
jgi:hypothetical protein